MGGRIRRRAGLILRVPLSEDEHAYAHVSTDPLVLFYDKKSTFDLSIDEIVALPIAFQVFVAKHAITSRAWPLVGFQELPAEKLEIPMMYKQDSISGRLYLHHRRFAETNYEKDASLDECIGLERAAVWDQSHIEDRLRDHFAGMPNKWVQSMAIDRSKLPRNQS